MKPQYSTLCALLLLAAACSDATKLTGPVENDDVTQPIQSDGGAEPNLDAGAGEDAASAEDAGNDASAEPVVTKPDTQVPAPMFGAVYAIFEEHCWACHIDENLGDLQFTTGQEAHSALVNAYASNLCGDKDRLMVVPGDPDASLLVHKIEHTHDCGTAMPPGEHEKLSSSEIKTIRAWIKAGAKL